MKVLFLQNIKSVAQIGDVKTVSDGFARNFLMPKKLAVPATVESLKFKDRLVQTRTANEMRSKERAELILPKLTDLVLEISADANEQGHLYGSIDAAMLVKELAKKGIVVAPDEIKLDHPIKSIGEHDIVVDLTPQASATIKAKVNATAS